jgi:spore coat polysaccharide biosynthesis protein SpsF
MEVLGKPLLAYLFERVKRAKLLKKIVVATTILKEDDLIAEFCEAYSIPCYRGEVEDVLGRYLGAAQQFSADVIVRLTGDCPLLDPDVIDKVVTSYFQLYPKIDYVANTLERTYPRGLDVEVFSLESLKIADREVKSAADREHVTSFIYKHPERFILSSVTDEKNTSRFRWTVDTQDDFRLIETLIKAIYPHNPNFTLDDLLSLVQCHPEWQQINSHIQQKQ